MGACLSGAAAQCVVRKPIEGSQNRLRIGFSRSDSTSQNANLGRMQTQNHELDLERLASLLCRELHIDLPSLGQVVRDAVFRAFGQSRDLQTVRRRLADAIEDGLANEGQSLDRHLNEIAIRGWRSTVDRALVKAIVHMGAVL